MTTPNAAFVALVAKYRERLQAEVTKDVTFTLRRQAFLQEALDTAQTISASTTEATEAGLALALGFIQGIMWTTGIINSSELEADIATARA